jgi:hypothetical protein
MPAVLIQDGPMHLTGTTRDLYLAFSLSGPVHYPAVLLMEVQDVD